MIKMNKRKSLKLMKRRRKKKISQLKIIRRERSLKRRRRKPSELIAYLNQFNI